MWSALALAVWAAQDAKDGRHDGEGSHWCTSRTTFADANSRWATWEKMSVLVIDCKGWILAKVLWSYGFYNVLYDFIGYTVQYMIVYDTLSWYTFYDTLYFTTTSILLCCKLTKNLIYFAHVCSGTHIKPLFTKASYASWSSSCFSKEYARGWTRGFIDTINVNPPPLAACKTVVFTVFFALQGSETQVKCTILRFCSYHSISVALIGFRYSMKKKQDEAHEPECRHVCWQTETILICHISSKFTCETRWFHTLRWHSCRAPLLDTIAQRSGETLLLDSLVRHSCKTLLAWHSCKTLLLDIIVRHSSLTLLFDTLVRHSYLTLLWDRLTWHSYLTLL